jgi:hypothetical protein
MFGDDRKIGFAIADVDRFLQDPADRLSATNQGLTAKGNGIC